MLTKKQARLIKKNNRIRKAMVFQNLFAFLETKFYRPMKVQMRGKFIQKIYMAIPVHVAIEYGLVQIEIPMYCGHKNKIRQKLIYTIGHNKLEKIGDKYYGWVIPTYENGELFLNVCQERIPAKKVFGESINRAEIKNNGAL